MRVDIRKQIKLNLILTDPELFIIYWTCHQLFWFRFLKLLLIFIVRAAGKKLASWKNSFWLGRVFF